MRKITRLTDCEYRNRGDRLLSSRIMTVATPNSVSFRDLANRRSGADSFNNVTLFVCVARQSSGWVFAASDRATNPTDNWSNRCYDGGLSEGADRCGRRIGGDRFEIRGAKVKRTGTSGHSERSARRGKASSGCWQALEAAPRWSFLPSRELHLVRVRFAAISGLQCSMNTSIKGGFA